MLVKQELNLVAGLNLQWPRERDTEKREKRERREREEREKAWL